MSKMITCPNCGTRIGTSGKTKRPRHKRRGSWLRKLLRKLDLKV